MQAESHIIRYSKEIPFQNIFLKLVPLCGLSSLPASASYPVDQNVTATADTVTLVPMGNWPSSPGWLWKMLLPSRTAAALLHQLKGIPEQQAQLK